MCKDGLLWRERKRDLQDRNHPLTILPTHLFHQLYACEDVACAAWPEEEAVVLDEVAGHWDGFGVGYSMERLGRGVFFVIEKEVVARTWRRRWWSAKLVPCCLLGDLYHYSLLVSTPFLHFLSPNKWRTYIPSTTVSTWCRLFVPSRSFRSYITSYLTLRFGHKYDLNLG